MSGKITDDIIMRVGRGIMKIPRVSEGEEKVTFSQSQNRTNAHAKLLHPKNNGDDPQPPNNSNSQD